MYAPVPEPRKDDDATDPYLPKPGDSEAVAAWRARMNTDEAKTIYKLRAATAETVNADGEAHRGLGATALRGIHKVTGGAYLFALTCDILRLITLGGLLRSRAPPRPRGPSLPGPSPPRPPPRPGPAAGDAHGRSFAPPGDRRIVPEL